MGRLQQISEPELERHLLREGIHELSASRQSCVDCGRTPLIGERYHRYARGRVVCDLCRPRHDDAPQTSDTVHHAERGQTVRVQPRAAVA